MTDAGYCREERYPHTRSDSLTITTLSDDRLLVIDFAANRIVLARHKGIACPII